jgi:hypothetical protein
MVERRGVAEPIWLFITEWVRSFRSMGVAFWALHDLVWRAGVLRLADGMVARVHHRRQQLTYQLVSMASSACPLYR